ncbi:MAG TPA: hypothetical protein VGM64_07420 [Lacunisphaera sp.]|jgi:hypothetical protein
MKPVWHIVRKDLFRLRWILLLWVMVLIAALGLAAIQAGLDDGTYFPFWIAASAMIVGVLPLIAFGLVMGLLHDDPVAEIDAFWITRPIAGGELLLAKLTALMVLAFVPVLIWIPFWLNYDYSWSQIVQASGQTIRMNFLPVMLALPFAVISSSASKFVMNVMVGAGVLLLLVLLFQLGNSREEAPVVPALLESKAWLIAGLWFVTVLVVTLNQFLRRQTRQSIAMLAIAVAAGFSIAKWWRWKLDGLQPASAEPATAPTEPGPDAPVISVEIAGETKRMVVMAEVPLTAGASSFRHGRMLKIQSVLRDFTGELQVTFSEATPQLSGTFRDLLPGSPGSPVEPNYYFIINRAAGGVFAVTPIHSGYNLDVATLRFSHATISARPELNWQGKPTANLATWLQDAVLVKVAPAEPAAARGVTSIGRSSP